MSVRLVCSSAPRVVASLARAAPTGRRVATPPASRVPPGAPPPSWEPPPSRSARCQFAWPAPIWTELWTRACSARRAHSSPTRSRPHAWLARPTPAPKASAPRWPRSASTLARWAAPTWTATSTLSACLTPTPASSSANANLDSTALDNSALVRISQN